MTPTETGIREGLNIAIVGVGLIGGSLGMAWRAAPRAHRVIGIVRRPEAGDEAVALGACDEATCDLAEGVAGADVVVVCTPVTAIVPTVLELLPHVRPGCIVTDAGSTKQHICETLWAEGRDDVPFIGGHPMAGSERMGVGAADPYLFQNAVYVLTPNEDTPAESLGLLRSLVEETGANTIVMDAARHDRIVAAISHVPHLVASVLVQTAAEVNRAIPETLTLAAGGFRDTTRIAAGSPEIWRDICVTNRDAILEVLDILEEKSRHLRTLLERADATGIGKYLAEAREQRLKVPGRSKGILSTVHEIIVRIVDRPGELAAVTGLLADAGLNIIDIEILRVREGVGGTLRIGFESEQASDQAVRVLLSGGYSVLRH